MNDNSIGDIEIKINRLLDGELDQSERESLQRRLLRDPEAHAMLRDYGSLDDQCRDAIGAALDQKPTERTGAGKMWAFTISVAAAAAAIVLGVALWPVFTERPDVPGVIAVDGSDLKLPTIPVVELVADRFDPTPSSNPMLRPVRQVDRVPVGLFDAESGQLKIILVDHEQEQREVAWLDL
ncbi:MAG: hypothetical protein GY794_17140 [bacterium]|nr:hypothetical protein [bacterium]